MSFGDSGLQSYGGGALADGAPVRFAHVDEAGTSKNEAICVVAGVVSNPDRQWLKLNQHLTKLADDFVPEKDRPGIIFHAKDIWHGTKKFRREEWPREKRLEILHEMAKIPHDFALPIISGVIEKANHNWGVPVGTPKWQAYNYSLAFGICAVHFEYVLREMCEPHELGTIIAEDVPEMRQHAKWGYGVLRDPDHEWQEIQGVKNYIPMQRVVEQPLFTEKTDSGILQVADFLAFVISRRLNGHEDVQPLFDQISSQLVILPHQR